MFDKLGRSALAAMAIPSLSCIEALGCSVCFGNPDSSMTQGMNMGILTLLLIVLPVLGGFASFIGYLIWRSHHPLEIEPECSGVPQAN